MTSAKQAIERSRSHNEIVTVDYDRDDYLGLLAECDDYCRGNEETEFWWGDTTELEPNDSWRVHMRHKKEDLVERCRVYRDGDQWVVVETGQAHDAVNVGVGSTLAQAYVDLEGTPIQSVGPDSGVSAALDWAATSWQIGRDLIEVDDAVLYQEDVPSYDPEDY